MNEITSRRGWQIQKTKNMGFEIKDAAGDWVARLIYKDGQLMLWTYRMLEADKLRDLADLADYLEAWV